MYIVIVHIMTRAGKAISRCVQGPSSKPSSRRRGPEEDRTPSSDSKYLPRIHSIWVDNDRLDPSIFSPPVGFVMSFNGSESEMFVI